MFRVVTIAREYGSGGGRVAQLLAGRLGWKLLDRCLVEQIARSAAVEPQVAEKSLLLFERQLAQRLDCLRFAAIPQHQYSIIPARLRNRLPKFLYYCRTHGSQKG